MRLSSASIADQAAGWLQANFPDCPAEWRRPFIAAVAYLVVHRWPHLGRPSLRALQLVRSAPLPGEGEADWTVPEACLWATGKTLILAANERCKSKV